MSFDFDTIKNEKNIIDNAHFIKITFRTWIPTNKLNTEFLKEAIARAHNLEFKEAKGIATDISWYVNTTDDIEKSISSIWPLIGKTDIDPILYKVATFTRYVTVDFDNLYQDIIDLPTLAQFQNFTCKLYLKNMKATVLNMGGITMSALPIFENAYINEFKFHFGHIKYPIDPSLHDEEKNVHINKITKI